MLDWILECGCGVDRLEIEVDILRELNRAKDCRRIGRNQTLELGFNCHRHGRCGGRTGCIGHQRGERNCWRERNRWGECNRRRQRDGWRPSQGGAWLKKRINRRLSESIQKKRNADQDDCGKE